MNTSGWDNLSVRPSARNCICRTNTLAGNGLRRSIANSLARNGLRRGMTNSLAGNGLRRSITNSLAGNRLRRSNNQPVTPIKSNRVGHPNTVQCNKDFIRPTRGSSIRKLTKT